MMFLLGGSGAECWHGLNLWLCFMKVQPQCNLGWASIEAKSASDEAARTLHDALVSLNHSQITLQLKLLTPAQPILLGTAK
jgi:hypothetical protein